MQHWLLECYKIYSNDDPGLTLTYLTARSNLVPFVFVWEDASALDFPETIEACEVKVGTYNQISEYIRFTQGKGHSLIFVQCHLDSKHQVVLSHLSYGASMGCWEPPWDVGMKIC